MLRVPNILNAESENQEFLYDQYLDRLINYKVDLVDDIDESYLIYDIIACITIPIKDIKLIVQVHGIDADGNIKYDLFGKTQSEHFPKDHVTLVELSIYDDLKIINIKELYKTLDGNGNSFNSFNSYEEGHIMNIERIHKICNATLSNYLCGRNSDGKDLFKEIGSYIMDYEDYLIYLEF